MLEILTVALLRLRFQLSCGLDPNAHPTIFRSDVMTIGIGLCLCGDCICRGQNIPRLQRVRGKAFNAGFGDQQGLFKLGRKGSIPGNRRPPVVKDKQFFIP